MSLSIMVALILTPALCATLLKPIESGEHQHAGGLLGRFFTWFNASFEATRDAYHRNLAKILNRTRLVMVVYALVVIVMAGLFYRLPTGFLPDEDQGFIINEVQAMWTTQGR